MFTNTAHKQVYTFSNFSLSLMTKQTKIVMTHLAGLCFFLFLSNKMFSRMFSSPKLRTPSVFQNQQEVASGGWSVFSCALFPFPNIKWLQKKFDLNVLYYFHPWPSQAVFDRAMVLTLGYFKKKQAFFLFQYRK